MIDYLKGKRCMVWSFMGNARMYQALRDYGDRIDTVGIFTFEVDITGTITETGTSISSMLTYINRWPHIKWLLPFWDKNSIHVSLDGTSKVFSENRLWWPYWRTTCWLSLVSGVFLSAGIHTVSVSTSVPGVQFYGFRVCSSFSEEPSAGEAEFMLSPRKFKDVNGLMAEPDKGFILTTEVLRRKPDSALIWYEDFRDDNPLPSSYWTALSGEWQVWQNQNYPASRPYSQLDGYGQVAWKYSGFSDVHLRARLAFTPEGSGRAGIFCGNVFCCLNFNTQRIELYNGSSLIGSYATEIVKTASADLRSNPRMYTIEMRIRGNSVRVYSGASNVLRFTATLAFKHQLEQTGLEVTMRVSHGREIKAACGQLANTYNKAKKQQK